MERPTVRRAITLDCSAAALWRLVSDPDLLGQWLGREVSLDLRPGGHGTLLDDDDVVRRLRVSEVVDGAALRFAWWEDGDPDGASEVTLTVEGDDAGSRLVVTETAGASASAGVSWDLRLISLWLAICSQAVATAGDGV
jgi:uncharacterized protein YndB with AHSA1/START domain